jgi:sialic acid synthase SpsE
MSAERVKIVAEMAWAHDGSIEKAIRIMLAAKEAGATAIGIHITDLPTYMVPHYGSGEGRVSAGKGHLEVYKYLDKINPSREDWLTFAEAAREARIEICAMANDLNSLAFCQEELHPDIYVLSAAAFVEEDLIVAVAKTGKPTLFRVGGATLGEIEAALHLFQENGGGEVTLLHGFQNYPTALEDTNIRQLQALKETFGVHAGLADHIDGSDSIAKAVPILALAFGATCVEKHITWDRSEKGEDFEAALNPADFREFVKFVRAGEVALGQTNWGRLSPASMRYRSVSRKRIVAARAIQKGHSIGRNDLAYKRGDVGLAPDQKDLVVGRQVKLDLEENDGISLEDLS